MLTYRDPSLKVFTGNANPDLARAIAEHIGVPLGRAEVGRFSDGEIQVKVLESVRGADVFVIQSMSYPVNDHFMELLIMIDALKRASAARINVVMPYYGYARQDRKARARDPITAKLVANLIERAGADRVIAMDLHAMQIQGFFDIPVDHLLALPILGRYFAEKGLSDIVVVSPDHGGVTRARRLADYLGASIAIIDKRRPAPNVVEVMNIVGDVRGRTAILVDDIIDTAGTILLGSEALRREGAERVFAACTHAVLSGPAVERLRNADLEEVIVTDTIPVPEGKHLPNLRILSVASLIAEAIVRVHEGLSVSKLFD